MSAASRITGVALVSSMLLLAACGSSNAPTTPTTPARLGSTFKATALVIVGVAYLPSVGQTTGLVLNATFVTGAVQVVNTTATWQSSNPSVAIVSSAGQIAAVGLGTSIVTATYQGLSASQQISVGASSQGQIAACGAFIGPGPFIVTADMKAATTGCLTFVGNVSAQLDCRGHDVSSVTLTGVQNFLMVNCMMHAGLPKTLDVRGSTGVTVAGADVLGTVNIDTSSGMMLRGNTLRWPVAAAFASAGCNSEVFVNGGQHNALTLNTIDGGWNGDFDTYEQQGCDDGIVLSNDMNDAIQGNTISNVWDAGIEAVGAVPFTETITGNTISHAGVAGISSYYALGWQNSTFSDNTVTGSGNLLTVYIQTPTAGLTTTFVNNRITNNTMVDQLFGAPNGHAAPIFIDFVSGRLPYSVSGNVIQGNNLSMNVAPYLAPANGFIDGGGNSCLTGGVLSCVGEFAFLRPLSLSELRQN